MGGNDLRIRDVLLVALTVSTGAVDAISWFGLGKIFSAFMTGNMAFLGFRAGGAAGPSVPDVLVAVALFAVGAAIGARALRGTPRDGVVWPRRITDILAGVLLAQVAFLSLWAAVGGRPSSVVGDVLIGLLSLGMGAQTAAIFSLGVRAVFTTAATATLTVLMGDVADRSQRSGETRRLAAVIVGLVAGAAIGGFLVDHARTWAPAFPLAMTALVVAAAASAFGGSELAAHPRAVREDEHARAA